MVVKNEANQPAHTSQLFTMRLWPEDLGGGLTCWRGKVQHVNSGEAQYFRDWPAMEAFVERLLLEIDQKGAHADKAEEAAQAPRFT